MRRIRSLILSAAAATAVIGGVLAVPLSAQASVPLPVKNSCRIDAWITGAHSIHVKATTCKWQADEPNPAYMSISYHFNVTGQTEKVEERTCSLLAGLSPCLKEYVFTGSSPSGKQTYRMSAYASWYDALGRRSTASASTAVVD